MGDFKDGTTNTNLPREIKKAKENQKKISDFQKQFRLRKAIGGNKLNKNGYVEYQTNILLKQLKK